MIDRMVTSSMKDTGIHPTKEDKIVTLSTCTGNESTRFVVQGKRVDAEDADGADGAATNTDSTADEENTDEISLDIAG